MIRKTEPPPAAPNTVRRNIETIARLEEKSSRDRSRSDRVADAIAGFSGSLVFVAVHVVLFTVWILTNLGLLPLVPKFDPYPFLLLSLLVSLEAIFLSTFVLIKQNRMSRRADQEMTRVLQMLQRIAKHLGVSLPGEQIKELSKETSVEQLAREVEKTIEPGSDK
jgi:uncharacterized membrane protein